MSNQNFTGDKEEFTKVPIAVDRSQQLFIRTICWNLASIVKNYHGIIEQLHFIAQRQAKLQNEFLARIKEEISAVILQSGSDDKWWLHSMNAFSIYEMTKTSWQTGNLKMNGNLENPSRTCFVRGWEFGKKIF